MLQKGIAMTPAALMGTRVRRKEDPRLITGTATYVGDLKLPGMQYVALVRSPYPHARIRNIDTTAAHQRPGVITVITGKELFPHCDPLPIQGGADNAGPMHKHQSRLALAADRVLYVGEAVAAVIATSPAAAVDAVADVMVDWEPLPVVVDPEQATAADAPQLFDDMPNNITFTAQRTTGDVDDAFANAFRIVSRHMVNQRLAGIPMETRAIVAAPDATTGGVTVWTSTQTPHLVRDTLAQVLNLPANQVRVIAPEVGGGFGAKIGIFPEDVLLAALARMRNTPLRWVESRTEHMSATTHGRAQVANVEAAVQQDGTVTALRVDLLADQGAYPIFHDMAVLTEMMLVGCYRIPNVATKTTCVCTNTTPVAAYRGAGRPEAAYYIERLMDLVATEMGIDPAEVRRKNFIPPEAFPYTTPTEIVYDTGDYDAALTKALELADYDALRAEQRHRLEAFKAAAAGGVPGSQSLLGIGISSYVEICGFGPYESARVRVEPSGSVTVHTGISPHGQGSETTFAQIVADQLGVNFDDVVVQHGDTGTTPMGQGTHGSRSLVVGGTALVRALEQVRSKAFQIAAHMLEAEPDDMFMEHACYQVRGEPGKGVTLAEIAERSYTDQLPDTIDPGLDVTAFFKPPDMVYPFGSHIAVVEIDCETGMVHLRNYISVDDCGPRISPQLVEGQVHGGLVQGIAQALIEEVVYDENGQLLTGSPLDYAIPHAEMFPPFTTDKTVTPTPLNPLGVKGIGEAATIGSTPAVVNAVLDALKPFGVHHLDMPLRPEKIWRVMHDA
jgi:carbon-monoxide dehydrogenase large subunit